jgi:hypothetical protein
MFLCLQVSNLTEKLVTCFRDPKFFVHWYTLIKSAGGTIKKNEMGGSYGTYGGDEGCMRGFVRETRGKEIIWKILAQMGG